MNVIIIRPNLPSDYPLHPSVKQIHLGLASIAAYLIGKGIDVEVFDNQVENKSHEYIAKYIKKKDPNLICINCDLITIDEVRNIISEIRKVSSAYIEVGGPQASIVPKETFLHTKPDFCVYGEGEITICELCEEIQKTNPNFDKINGLIYEKNGGVVCNPPRKLMENLDEIPFMPLELFPMDKYVRSFCELEVYPVDLMCTSRGCPYTCRFCSNEYVWGHKVRAMSAKRVVDEIEHMVEKYDTKGIYFREDNFTILKKRVGLICDEIKSRGIEIEWICQSRVKPLDEEVIKKMADAGCKSVWFGVESGSQKILDMLNKGITLSDIKRAFDIYKKYGIKRGASVMIGIPGESLDDIQKTRDLINEIKPDYVFWNPFLGIPGSEIYDEIKDRKELHYNVYKGMILLNNEVLNWPEKVKLADKYYLEYITHNKNILKLFVDSVSKYGIKHTINVGFEMLKNMATKWPKN